MCSLVSQEASSYREALDGGIPFGGRHRDNSCREQPDRSALGRPPRGRERPSFACTRRYNAAREASCEITPTSTRLGTRLTFC
jgi:hypothetical protein